MPCRSGMSDDSIVRLRRKRTEIYPPPERGRAGWGSAAEKLAQASPPRTPTWLASLASSPFQGEEKLRVRLALRIDDFLKLAEHVHARQQLGEAGVRLALFPDRGDEFAVFELDTVHRHVDLRHVDLVILAVAQIVVKRLVGAVV